MARWMDSIIVWTFTIFSAFCWMMILTQENILLSALLTLGIILFLRFILEHIPHRKSLRKKERLSYIKHLLKKWALLPQTAALNEIRAKLPDLFTNVPDESIYLIQKMPDTPPLDVNQLLDIWHKHHHSKTLLLLCTCALSTDAAALLPELTAPSVQVLDSLILTTHLLPLIQEIPPEIQKTERRVSIRKHITLLVHNIRPARSGLYAVIFFVLYLSGKSWIHLSVSCIFGLLTLIYWFTNRRPPLPSR